MDKVTSILRCILLIAISFNGYADLYQNSPTFTYVGPVEATPGATTQIRVDKVLANVTPRVDPRGYGGIAAFFYWCRSDGLYCTGPDGVTVPEQNILAKTSLCPTYKNLDELINCLHSQIAAGMYTIKVPDVIHGNERPRAQICLRYIASTSNNTTFANSDNACQYTPNNYDWCSMVTPTINLDFGTLVYSKAQGVSMEKDLAVYCTGPVSYKLSLAGQADSSVALGNGMKVDIRLDGKELNTTLSSSGDGVTSYKLKATLEGTPSTTGAFNATSVLYVSFQ